MDCIGLTVISFTNTFGSVPWFGCILTINQSFGCFLGIILVFCCQLCSHILVVVLFDVCTAGYFSERG